ncbi:hypothetical protein JNW91_30925 [Micromonospora sp. STR1_7]|uniref:Uncharacterized protein n=1 Tax=Micromonospora parastrephiae TaxID=2806101 RepID=A0ABS1Y2P2_9ACTN|nr:hypothetical protein [Micromonospora parastrephiae]MBM0235785.1 hypothetical protein [Micromonospora parastrephiae]
MHGLVTRELLVAERAQWRGPDDTRRNRRTEPPVDGSAIERPEHVERR